ncbi:hypothetical protein KMP13_12735 [Epibacterium ulvae]|uniref:hypothetical protein n=1 Tax=Epibacterium ulvae TaxID=1156985 RepID=UPI001BFBFDAB|nr:hypothetical protein [Epibacterium ulvae]MBT8154736.1 hypothetical protein [Epibacterium ulvae]
MRFPLFAAFVAFSTFSACSDLRNVASAYSYLEVTGTHLSSIELPGQVFLLDASGEKAVIQELDVEIDFPELEVQSNGDASLASSKISGASADLVKVSDANISGTLAFQAKVDAVNVRTSRILARRASSLLEGAYEEEANKGFSVGQEPLFARKVVNNEKVYYAFITGRTEADKLKVTYGAPEKSGNGINVQINDIEFSNVKISNDKFWECNKTTSRATCGVAIELLDAKWVNASGVTKLDIFPAPKNPNLIAKLFRAK